jgi:TolB-like protein
MNDGSAQTRPREKVRETIRERRDSRYSQALTDEAIALYKQGKNILATAKVEQALRFDDRNDRALALSAELAFKAGRHVIAKTQSSRALLINNKNHRAHFVLGRVLIAEGKTLAGFDHIRKAANSLPDGQDKEDARMSMLKIKEQHPEWFTPRQPADPGQPAASPARMMPLAEEGEILPALKPRMAVFTFENIGIVDSTMKWGESISEMLTTSLINSNRFKVIERAQLDKVLQEQALGQTGALDSETAVVVGKIMGLDAVVVGSVSKLASQYEADARILNVESGEAITAANAAAQSANQLRSIADMLAGNFAQHAHQIPVRSAPADSTK